MKRNHLVALGKSVANAVYQELRGAVWANGTDRETAVAGLVGMAAADVTRASEAADRKAERAAGRVQELAPAASPTWARRTPGGLLLALFLLLIVMA